MSPPPIIRHWKRAGGIAATAAALAASALLTAPAATAAPATFDGTPAYFSGVNTNNGLDTTGADLTWNGNAAYANDNFPSANSSMSYKLDGNTTLTDSDTDVGNLGTGDFAIGLHYKTSTSADRVLLLSKQETCSGRGPSWLQIALADSSVYVEVVNPSNAAEFSGSPVSAIDGKWHYVELIRHNDTLHLYFDGRQIGNAHFTGANPSNDAPLTLGGGACSGARSDWINLTGELSYAYMGPGSTYTLSQANADAAGPAGGTGDVTFNYANNIGTAMHATVTQPDGTTLAGLDGPGCERPTPNQCWYNLTGHGAPITATVNVPSDAAVGSTLSGGNFRMVDTSLPLSPASTGWDAATATANLPFGITVSEVVNGPMADWSLAGGIGGAVLLFGGAVLLLRRRRSASVTA